MERSFLIDNGTAVTSYAAPPVRSDSATFFAFDDHAIPFRENLRVRMHHAHKHPDNPVVPRGDVGDPDHVRAQYYGSVVCDGDRYRMWYVAAAAEAEHRPLSDRFDGWRPAYAESSDGVHWTKPALGLVDYRGSTRNNLVAVHPPDTTGIHLVVLDEPDDPKASQRYKMLLTVACHLRDEERSTSLPLVSADGLHWRTVVPSEFDNYHLRKPLLPPEAFEQSGFYRWGGIYHVTGQQKSPWTHLPDGSTCGRVMTIYRSRDLVHWEPTKALGFVRDGYRTTRSGEGEEAHLPASVWNRGNVLLGLYGQWHGDPRADQRCMHLGLVCSNDGIHFREPVADFPIVQAGEDGRWDQGGLVSGQGFVHVGDHTLFWYGAWDLREIRSAALQRGAIGLAKLRRDGFGSIERIDERRPGTMVTCPFVSHRELNLFLNVGGTDDPSALSVELLDQWERPVPGFSAGEIAPLPGTGVQVPVAWRGAATLPAGGPYRLKVGISETDRSSLELYALSLEPAG